MKIKALSTFVLFAALLLCMSFGTAEAGHKKNKVTVNIGVADGGYSAPYGYYPANPYYAAPVYPAGYYAPQPYYVVPQPVYVAPQPVYMAPEPRCERGFSFSLRSR